MHINQVGTYDQFREMFRGMGITSQFSNVFSASMVSGNINELLRVVFLLILFSHFIIDLLTTPHFGI